MAASQAALAETATTVALEMSEHIETLAAAGEWDDVEDIVARLRSTIMRVPEAERRSVILEVQASLERVAVAATSARESITGKISELRRGQAAKKAYELR